MKGRRGSSDPSERMRHEMMLNREVDPEFEEEFREFLEADHVEVDADPLFRERLRRRLWALLLERIGSRSLSN
jgi:hypothetical protein